MDTETFEIMFNDLNEDTQNKLLEFYGIKSLAEMNWEVFPVATIEVDGEELAKIKKESKELNG